MSAIPISRLHSPARRPGLAFLLVWVGVTSPFAADAGLSKERTPSRTVERFADALVAAPEENVRLTSRVEPFMDFQAIATASLGDRWGDLTPPQQKEFTRLLTERIEEQLRNAKKVLASKGMRITKEEKHGPRAQVLIEIGPAEMGREVIFELRARADAWAIDNLVVESADMVRMYQSYYNQMLFRWGPEEVLRRMREHIESGAPRGQAVPK
jgi:ABC-type transporter MlaC component